MRISPDHKKSALSIDAARRQPFFCRENDAIK
jgi:hypothetical protein